MSDTTNIRKSADSIITQSVFDGYSKVVVVVSDEQSYTAGNDTGRTLTVSSPWGTQDMANKLLAKIRGYQYQPYAAQGAMLDPAAEIGDGITAGKTYSGIFQKNVSLGPLYTADVSAPGGERINYQYKYKSPTDRQLERQGKETRASLRLLADRINLEVQERKAQGETFTSKLEVQSQLISAKVSKTGGDNSSFGWELDATKHVWEAKGTEVVRFDGTGAKIIGEIQALRGKIGGFDIQADFLSYNGQTWGGTNTQGGYFGINGIQLGRNFSVDMRGHAVMESADIRGTLRAGDLIYGGDSGYFDGGGLHDHSVGGGKVGYSTISTANTAGDVNTSLAYANFSSDVFNNRQRAPAVPCDFLSCNSFYFGDGRGGYVHWRTKTIGGVTIQYLGR